MALTKEENEQAKQFVDFILGSDSRIKLGTLTINTVDQAKWIHKLMKQVDGYRSRLKHLHKYWEHNADQKFVLEDIINCDGGFVSDGNHEKKEP